MSNEAIRRLEIVKQAIANQRLESLKVSEKSKRIAGEYVSGKITATAAAEKIRDQYYEHA